MKTKEALQLIQEDRDNEDINWDSPLGRAYLLSFEALKRHHGRQHLTFTGMMKPLPGETEE